MILPSGTASSSWIGGAVPVWNDTAKWNNTVLGANSPALGGNVSVLGVIIDNPGGAVTINGANTLQTGFRGADLSSATADLTLSMNNLALMEFAGVIWNVGAGRVMTVNASTLTRGYGSSVVVQGSGVVTSTVMVNDPTGVIAPWARIGTGSATRYATMSGGSVAGYAGGAAAATAGDITDVTGTVNYDLAGVGTWGSGPSFNTLRYTGSSGTVAGAYSANGILNAGSGTLILSGASTIGKDKELVITSPDDTRRVALSGVVGDSDEGASGLTVTGNGRVDLTADNSYTGQTVVNAGQLFVSNDNALGTTNGSTVIYVNGSRSTGGQLVLRGSVTLLEPLTFVGPGDGNPWHQALRVDSGGGTNTLAGPITIEGRGVRLTAGGSGTTLNINAPLTRTSSGTALILGAGGAGGVVNVNATINNNSGSLELHNGPGLVRINSKENNFGTLNVQTDHLTQLGVSDAFVNWCNLSVGGSPFTSGNQARGTFDLAGYSQAFNSFNGNGVVGEPPSTRVITNSSVVLSTLTSGSSGGSGTFNGIFSGNIAYVKNGAGTQNLIHLNSYTGGTTVNGGTLVLNNASNHGSLSVNNGTFRFSPSLIVNGNLSGQVVRSIPALPDQP
ncbi:MAG: autotransporter-associated beta strand repeat-containing protein [Kiritimatiellae bacterium]|nr:autotransporter-associated beta strand repeat-containing protein [Kiritimatiellia bacterium]